MLSTIVNNVGTNEIKEAMIQKMLYADDLVLIAETMAELQKKWRNCRKNDVVGKVHLTVRV